MSKCNGIIGFLFGHNFQPRFDEKITAPTDESLTKILGNSSYKTVFLDNDIHALKHMRSIDKKYIHDVCPRCGEIKKIN